MQYLTICIALILIAQITAFSFPTTGRKHVSSLNMLFGFGKKASSSTPAAKSGSSKSSAPAKKSTEKGKDMTWGGR